MGLAASQARLLSITSRMADNELRAQLINNAKMRLTEDTQKASDKYISALNKTQYMMSNKDTLGNPMYQQLTFNNLTAYSSYNNQYGLINKSGQIVVSELDAAKFETAINNANNNPDTTPLVEFLSQYGIKKADTTYWNNPEIDNDLQAIYEGDVEYDDAANRISGLHYGYEMSKTSTEVMVYERLLDTYKDADTAYTKAVIASIKDFLYGYTPNGETKTYEEKYDEVINFNSGSSATPMTDSQNALNYLEKYFDELVGQGKINRYTTDEYGNQVNTEFYNNMQYYFDEMIQFNTTATPPTANIEYPASIGLSEDSVSGNTVVNINGGEFILEKSAGGGYTVTGVQAPEDVYNEAGDVIGQITYGTPSGVTKNGDEYSFNYSYTYPDETGAMQTVNGVCKFTDNPDKLAATTTELGDEYDTAETIRDIYSYFQQNILNNVDRNQFATNAPAQKAAFNAAAQELSMFIFGYDIGEQDYENLDDMEWIINSGIPNTNLDGNTYVDIEQNINGTLTNVQYLANFEAIKDIYLIEQMIEKYGAPKYTWIDINNPNENADAKAQWYTNLFEKMQESGYQKIELGLTKSAEWIQYAFESGLLSMVQVNDEYEWVSTMYSNCSDITEDTIEIEITRAEAEYKRETQKIQAKDKRFDMELKNIDTEHNSLQSEYDSIKSVINKNVERHFKLFG